MITVNELVDLRMQQHFAQELYRQQIMQRLPDPFHHMLPLAMSSHHVMMAPARPTLPDCKAKLENRELWQQFHHIGTEMIITKTGRRMFPSMRLSLSGLEEDANYCVLLEMVPIGDCRYKFSGSQWVPAGGAEPQSPQRMFLHPDSPATGAHWQTQPILFNKVKLTNNTLDNNGHMVLASMHKYQPRLHIIRTADLTQLPWAPQQDFIFPETEFVAVTAYQNDRITKLKIDNNPFAKGFRESGQSRCKRKLSTSPTLDDQPESSRQQSSSSSSQQQSSSSPSSLPSLSSSSPSPSHRNNEFMQHASALCDDDRASFSSHDSGQMKRLRSNGSACSASSLDEGTTGSSSNNNSSTTTTSLAFESPSPRIVSEQQAYTRPVEPNAALQSTLADLAFTYFAHPHPHPFYPVDYRATNLGDYVTHVMTDATHVRADAAHVMADATHVRAHATHVMADATHVRADATHVRADATHVRAHATHVMTDATHVRADATHVMADATHMRADATHVMADATHVRADATHMMASPLTSSSSVTCSPSRSPSGALELPETFVDVESTSSEDEEEEEEEEVAAGNQVSAALQTPEVPVKRHNFSISAILGNTDVLSA